MYKNKKGGGKLITENIKSRTAKISMILIITAVIFTFGISSVSAAEWTVGPGGTYDFTNIAAAIDAAADDDTITVYDDNGNNYTYNENVSINKKVTVKASGNVTVRTSNSSKATFSVSSLGSGTTIQGFTITGATNSYGILLELVNECNIIGNNITGNWYGIYSIYSNNTTLTNNNITGNQNGTYIYGSLNNTISGNNISSNNYNGLWLDNSNTNTISGNTVTNNQKGIYLSGSSSNTISGNTVTSNQNGIYILNSLENQITGNNQITGSTNNGIYLSGSSTNTISGNTITNNYNGIYLDSSSYNTISGNTIEKNQYGCYLESSSNQNTISENNIIGIKEITSIYGNGVYLKESSANTISGNTITDTSNGIYLYSSSGNQITGNNYITNSMGSGYGIHFLESSNNTISGNTITFTFDGIYFESSSINNTISGNAITSCMNHGIYISSSSGSTINGNNYISSNYGDGIAIQDSSDNNIRDNILESNPTGIHIYDIGTSSNNNIYRNTITYNTYGIQIENSGMLNITSNSILSNYNCGIFNTGSGILNVTFNSILGNYNCGINNTGSSTVNATNNWWGSNNPTVSSTDASDIYITGGTVIYNPWLIMNITASPTVVSTNANSTITVDLTHNNLGEDTSSMGYIPDGTSVYFETNLGAIYTPTGEENSYSATLNGIALAIFRSSEPGIATVSAYSTSIDNAVSTDITVGGPDLIPTITEKPVNPYTGTTHPVKVTIRNDGTGNAGTFKVRLYDIYNGERVLVEEKIVEGLNYGNSVDLTWNWTPAIGTPGNHHLVVVVDEDGDVPESDETNNEDATDVNAIGRPDPTVPSTLTRNSTIYTNVKYPVKATITNNGDAIAEDCTVELKDGETSLGILHIYNLGIGASETLTWDWTPAFGATGTHNLILIIDSADLIYEINETNNLLNEAVNVIGRPDLTNSTGIITNGTIYTNVTYQVNVTVKNNGDASAGNFDVKLFDGETNLGILHVENLGMGNTRTLTWNWTPTFGATGIHNLIAVIDYLDQQYEINETNNNVTLDKNVLGRPELTNSTGIITNGTIYTNVTYQVNVTVKNNGDANAGQFNVELFDGATSLGTRTVASLGIGAIEKLTWNWTPTFGAAGIHNLIAVIDSLDQQYEINETNNNVTLAVNAIGRPDLTVPSSLTRNGTIYTNVTYPVSATITNNGDATAEDFTVELKDGSTSLGIQHITSLGTGATRTLTWNWTPAFGSAGNHLLQLIINLPVTATYDFNETNNILNENVAVTGRPDLAVPSSLTRNSTIYTNVTYPVSATITNKGDAVAEDFTVELKDGETSLGIQHISSLGIGATRTLTWNWTPAFGSAGNHLLQLITNLPVTATYDFNETNNILNENVAVTGRADLLPSNLTANGTIYTNVTYPVSVKITNKGDTATETSFKVRLYDNGALVEEKTVAGLAVDGYTTLTFDWKPLKYAVGNHALLITTDLDNLILESNETNNNMTLNVNAIGRPDLIPSDLITNNTGTTYTGVQYSVTAKITNNGDAATGTNFKVRLYDNGALVEEKTVAGLNAGAFTTLTWNWTPLKYAVGNHVLLIATDLDDLIYESNETNNNITTNVNVLGRPDLVLTTIQGPANPCTNAGYPVYVTVTNSGDANAGSFVVKLLDGSTIIGTLNVGELAINGTTTLTFNWTPLTVGSHTLEAVADSAEQQFEISETNNSATQQINVKLPPAVSSVTPANGSHVSNGNQVITITFSEDIQAGSAYNNIRVITPTGQAKSITKSISGNTLTITAVYSYTSGTYTIYIPVNAIADLAGNGLQTSINSTFTVDVTAPTINSVTPPNGSTGIPVNQVITITFSENIQAGSVYGSITVKNTSGVEQAINKDISGNILTITVIGSYADGNYILNIPINAITDLVGNRLAAYNSTFTVDGIAPIITNVAPVNGSKVNNSNQVITVNFSEDIQAGSVYDSITVKNSSGTAQTITKSINGNVLTITIVDGYTDGTYTLNIPVNATADLAGNGLQTAINSTFTVDVTAPTINSVTPTNGSTVNNPNQIITVNFSEDIQAGDAYDDITVKNSSGVAQTITKTINGNILTITIVGNYNDGNYTLNIPVNAIIDLAGNNVQTALNSTFTIAIPPTISSINPTNSSTVNNPNQVIIITFSEDIQAGSAYNNIKVITPAGQAKSITKTINGNTLTITAAYSYTSGTYTIYIPVNAVTDLAGNGLQTILNSTFTVDAIPPAVNSITPSKGSTGIPVNQVITITFSENIQAGDAYDDITVKNASGTTQGINKSINGNVLTMTIIGSYADGTYTLNIPVNAIKDLAGNGVAAYNSTFTVDGIAPNVMNVTPVNGSTVVNRHHVITITFNESIQAGDAYDSITVKNSSGVAQTITKTINDNVLTITIVDGYADGIYTLNIPVNAIKDLAGNGVAAYNSTFIVDATAPIVNSVTPTNGSTVNNPNQVITVNFSEDVQTGSVYDSIIVKNASGVEQAINKSINGNVLTITIVGSYADGNYTVYIPLNAIADMAGNNIQTTFNSTFTAAIPPTISSIDPINGSIVNIANKVITITFSEDIQAGSAYNIIKVITPAGQAKSITKTINGNILTITAAYSYTEGTYTIYIPTNAIKDLAGNNIQTTFNSTFTIAIPPTISSIDPVNGSTVNTVNKVIKVTFSEAIQAGSAYNIIKVITPTGQAKSITKTISGNTLTITAVYSYTPGTYTIYIPTNAIKDLAGNGFASNYTSSFTINPVTPTVTSVDPTNGSTVTDVTKVIRITFSENIQASNAYNNIRVITPAGQAKSITKSISGNTLTITAVYSYTPGTYTIYIPVDAVKNTAGNGIAVNYTSNFTIDTTAPTVTSVDPANESTVSDANKVITITFSEDIEASNAYNNIKVITPTGQAKSITKTINGNILTITAAYSYTEGTYTIYIPVDAVKNATGNGIAATYTSTFTISRVN